MPETGLTSECDLVRRLRARDERAYEEVVRAYGGQLMAVATRILGREDDARDALQDAMIAAVKGIDRFEGQSKLSTWLHRIVVNASLQILRKKKRTRETAIDDLMPVFDHRGHTSPISGWSPRDGDALQAAETRSLVRDKISDLPDDYRDVLLLRDIEELDTQETATVLGITPGAVKTRLHRARQALRTLLEQELA